VIGGNLDPSLLVYHTKTDSWEVLQFWGQSVVGHSATLIGRKIYVFGGAIPDLETGAINAFDTMHIVDLGTRQQNLKVLSSKLTYRLYRHSDFRDAQF